MNTESNNTNNSMTELVNDCSIETKFFNRIHDAVKKRVPTLDRNANYTLKKICGKEFWEMMLPGDQKAAGWCMTHLVATKQVPMVWVGKNDDNAKIYQLE